MSGDYMTAFVADARTTYALFDSMRTKELLDVQAAHEADQVRATTPESIVFSAGRLALIAAVLKARGIGTTITEYPSITCPVCQWTSYNPNDIRERYCGHCHRFHEDLSR
jgi:hypothetical protein